MNQLTKAQITVGLLSFFATVWPLVQKISSSIDVAIVARIVILLVVLLVLSIVILGILEWVNIFDLKTNSVLTIMVLITLGISSTFGTF